MMGTALIIVFTGGLACGIVSKVMINKVVDKVVDVWLEKETRKNSKTEKDGAAK